MEFINKIKASSALSCSLCMKCSNGLIMIGEGRESVHCGYMGEYVKFVVKECTAFRDRYSITLAQMEDSAWILKTDKSKAFVGFERPEEKNKKSISHMFD